MRVSTDDQVEGHSLDAQRIEIERHCKRQGFVLIRQYADEGVSAHTEDIARRPQLAALLEDARHGEFDVVVVHTLDRWARNVGVQREALQLLGTAGVGFASVTEDIDFTAPAGKLMLTMIGGVSEFFSDQLGVHVSKAQKHRAESGLPVGGVPFGYVVPEPGGVPLLEPERGAAVAEAFERRERGDSYATIAASFNEREFVTTRGNPFTAYTIKDMLKTRFYVGVILYNGAEYPGQHEALIDEAAFRRLQLRRPRRQPRSKRGGAVLRGLVRCNGCHRPIYPDRHHTGRVLYRERHMRECSTEGTSVDANRIDGQIRQIMAAVELPDAAQLVALEVVRGESPPDVSKLEARRKRLARAFGDGAYTEDEYEVRLAEIDSQLRLATPVDLSEVSNARELVSRMDLLWDEATSGERARIVAELFDSAYLDLRAAQVAAIAPRPGFRMLLEQAKTRSGAEVKLISPHTPEGDGAGGDGGESNSPSSVRAP